MTKSFYMCDLTLVTRKACEICLFSHFLLFKNEFGNLIFHKKIYISKLCFVRGNIVFIPFQNKEFNLLNILYTCSGVTLTKRNKLSNLC